MVNHIPANAVHLTSAENKHVKAVLRLRRQRERRRCGLFVAEGVRQVKRAADAGLVAEELYWCDPCEEAQDQAGRRLLGALAAKRLFTVTPRLMAKMSYRKDPQPVLAVFAQPVWQRCEQALPARSPSQRWESEIWLVAVGTQKPGNLGSMVRTAEAAGCHGVLVADGVVDAFNPNAICASTGAVFRMPVYTWSTQQVLAELAQRAVRVVAAVPDAPHPYTRVDLTGPVALVVGSEDAGLPQAWLDATAQASTTGSSAGVEPAGLQACQVSIPMFTETVDSLNAATSAAILLFEAVRQRLASAG